MDTSPQSKIIIGLKGPAGAGKDTVANYLVEKHGFTKVTFAGPLKEICAIITGWPLDMLKGETEESRKFRETVVHPDFGKTGREILQFVGTDVFRDHFDPQTWIKIATRRILNIQGNVVVSDVRFPNEVDAILSTGGKIYSINRSTGTLIVPKHISEQLLQVDGEVVLNNNGSFEDLYKQIDTLIQTQSVSHTMTRPTKIRKIMKIQMQKNH